MMGSLVASAWGLPALHVVSAGMLVVIGLWYVQALRNARSAGRYSSVAAMSL